MKNLIRITYSILSLLAFVLSLQSCKDEPTYPENQNNPEIIIAYPPDSAYIRDDINIKVNVYNISNLENVTFYIDGNVVERDSTAPYEYFWNVYYWEDETHTILAEAVDNENVWRSDLQVVFLDKLSHENVSPVLPPNSERFTQDNKVEFVWNKFNDAAFYILETASDPLFVYDLNIHTVPDTSVIVQDFSQGNYYWHVKAVEANNLSGGWSTVRSFEISNPDPPELLLPENNTIMNSGETAVLVWCSSPVQEIYEYQVSPSADFSDIAAAGQQQDTTIAINNLPMNAYYWRVRSRNAAGFWSEWSDSSLFGLGVFSRTYGGDGAEYGSCAVETADHGFLLLGKTHSYGNGVYDVYLIKTDEMGNVIWTKTYGTPFDERGEDLKLTSDGGIIITGATVTDQNPYDNYDVYLIKTDAQGNVEWEKSYGYDNNDFGLSVIETDDSGFLVSGMSYNGADMDVYLIKTDNYGTELWSRTFGTTELDRGSDIIKAGDGNYLITGSLNGTCLIKIDGSGNEIWSKTYDNYESEGRNLCRLSSGNLLITGWAGSANLKLICTDSDGNQLWNKILAPGFGNAAIEMDNSILCVGDQMAINADALIYKTDFSGNIIWSLTTGGSGYDVPADILETYDGGFVIFGNSSSFGSGDNDLWLAKFNEDGNTLIVN